MDAEEALLEIGRLLSAYEDDEWEFDVSWYSHKERIEVEMKRKKVFGEN